MRLDATEWGKSNIWRLASGELCVRPGLRRVYTPSSREIVGGFSISNAGTAETWHYIFDIATSGNKDVKLRIIDEDFQTFQIFSYGVNTYPRGLSYAQVQGQILINSPDLPPLWGLVGNGVIVASPVASDTGDPTITIPSGIVTSWNNRPVICRDSLMYVGDPLSFGGGDLRTFIGRNVNQRPGAIYGVHEGAGGMLLTLTSAGVYALGNEASAVGVVGSNGSAWAMLNHASINQYDSSCQIDGRVYMMTKDGYAQADVEDAEEVRLTEAYQPRAYGPRVSLEDYRRATILPGEHGPIVVAEDLNAAHFSDDQSGIRSWWKSSHSPTDFKVRGLLTDIDGADMLLCGNGVFRIGGDFDGETALTSGVSTQPKAFFFGGMPTAPATNTLVQAVHVGTDVGVGGNVYAAVRGRPLPTVAGTTGVNDEEGQVIGTDVWGVSTKRYVTSSIQGIRFGSAETACHAGDEVTVEVGADTCLTRISLTVDIDTSPSNQMTPKKVV